MTPSTFFETRVVFILERLQKNIEVAGNVIELKFKSSSNNPVQIFL